MLTKGAPERHAGAEIAERELRHEAQAVTDFIETLGHEQRALAEHRVDALNELAAEKAARLTALSGFAARRSSQLKAAGYKQDAEGMRAWLATLADFPRVAFEWGRVNELMRQARGENEINGWLIAITLQRTQRQLAFLNSAASNEPVYCADGLARPSVLRRSLGEA